MTIPALQTLGIGTVTSNTIGPDLHDGEPEGRGTYWNRGERFREGELTRLLSSPALRWQLLRLRGQSVRVTLAMLRVCNQGSIHHWGRRHSVDLQFPCGRVEDRVAPFGNGHLVPRSNISRAQVDKHLTARMRRCLARAEFRPSCAPRLHFTLAPESVGGARLPRATAFTLPLTKIPIWDIVKIDRKKWENGG